MDNQQEATSSSNAVTVKTTAVSPQDCSFWQVFPEKVELNQYWYSEATIETLAQEVLISKASRCAFLSTPSVYYAVKAKDMNRERNLFLFDYDEKFATEGTSFVQYDFHQPESIPIELYHSMDFIIIDPPFITKEVWEQYTITAKLLLRPSGSRILLSTIVENESMIQDLLSCTIQKFKPSIPHLVYQYALYANYKSSRLSMMNPGIGDE